MGGGQRATIREQRATSGDRHAGSGMESALSINNKIRAANLRWLLTTSGDALLRLPRTSPRVVGEQEMLSCTVSCK